MADSLTEQILARVKDLLENGTGKPAGVTVTRSRLRPAENTELPLYSVRPGVEQVEKAVDNVKCPIVERTLNVLVKMRCVGTDKELDPHRSYVIAALMASLSLGLAFVIEVTEEEHEWDAEDASDADYAEDVIRFAVRYRTARNDVTRSA